MRKRAGIDSRLTVPSVISFNVSNKLVPSNGAVGQTFRFNAENIIKSDGNAKPVCSYYFPEYPFYSITAYRRAAFFRDDQAEAMFRRGVIVV